jgi:hypothetical protein
MKPSNYYYLILGMMIAGAILFLGRDYFLTDTGISLFIVFILATAAGLLLFFYLGYRKSQKRDTEAALARRLMANPQFRDAIIKSQKDEEPKPEGPKTDPEKK